MNLKHLVTVLLFLYAMPLASQTTATGCFRITVGNWCIGQDVKTVELCAVVAYLNNRPVAGGYTDTTGRLTITTLPPGDYQLVFTRFEYQPDTLQLTLPPGSGCVSGFMLLETNPFYATFRKKHWLTGRSVFRCRLYPRPSQIPQRRFRTVPKPVV